MYQKQKVNEHTFNLNNFIFVFVCWFSKTLIKVLTSELDTYLGLCRYMVNIHCISPYICTLRLFKIWLTVTGKHLKCKYKKKVFSWTPIIVAIQLYMSRSMWRAIMVIVLRTFILTILLSFTLVKDSPKIPLFTVISLVLITLLG